MCDSEGHMSDAFAAVQRRSWLVLQLGEQSIGPNPPPGRGRDMAATTPKIQTLRCLIREIRRTLLPHENLRHSPAFEYMMKEYRHNAVTDQQYCRQQEEMAYLAHTCATYLEASRRYQELHQEYHCRGERTVKETADIVGFKLPNEH